jgi:hypothetical protein
VYQECTTIAFKRKDGPRLQAVLSFALPLMNGMVLHGRDLDNWYNFAALSTKNYRSVSTIADIRKEYMLQTFSEQEANPNPFKQFEKWWLEAIDSDIEEANAMTLATTDATGTPMPGSYC